MNVVLAGLLLIACSSPPKPAAVTNQATAIAPPIVPIGPCPFGVLTPFDHELFAGCAPPPFTQSFGVCGHHACPRPCKIQEGDETVVATYDHGRFVESKHLDESKKHSLEDVACTYEAGRMTTCTHSFYGPLAATRDSSGDLTKLVETEKPDQPRVFTYDAHHRVASYAEYHESFEVTYGADDRIERVAWHLKGRDSPSTYRYDSDGDLIESIDNAEGMHTSYEYGPTKLLEHIVVADHDHSIVDTRLAYDASGRLVSETATDPARAQTLYVTSYTYCD